jgi:hypothetical protein
MRYCVQIRNGQSVRMADADSYNGGVHHDRYSHWHRRDDAIFDFDKIEMADKYLAQALSTSKGSDPRRKYADYLWTIPEYDLETPKTELAAEADRAHQWRGLWVLVLEGYKRREVGKYTGPETVTVHPRVLWAHLPGETRKTTRLNKYSAVVEEYTGANYVETRHMHEITPDTARQGQVFTFIRLSLGG